MEILLNKRDFIKAAQIGGSFSGKSKLLPILDCVKIIVNGSKMYISSCDNENSISTSIDIEGNFENKSFCINYKDAIDYIKLIPTEMFSFIADFEKNELKIEHFNGSFNMPIESADEFPATNIEKETKDISIAGDVLFDWIGKGINFTSSDDLRPVMTGIYIYVKDGKMGFCSTDGHILINESTDYYDKEMETSFIINRSTNKSVMMSICGDTKIKVGTKNVLFQCGNTFISSRIIEGKYPNFESVIPQSNAIRTEVNRKKLIDAINRSNISSSSNGLIIMDIESNSIKVMSENIDYSKKSSEKIECNSNESIRIGVNYKAISNVLNSFSSDDIYLEMNDPTRAILVKSEKEESIVTLAMPMMI